MFNLQTILKGPFHAGPGATVLPSAAFHFRQSASLNKSTGKARLLLGFVPEGDFMGPFTGPVLLDD
jgi:hypothetical protein